MALSARPDFLRVVRPLLLFCLGLPLTGCVARVSREDAPAPTIANPGELDVRIDVAHFDRALLARAVFDKTNTVRAQLGLKPFHYLSKLDEAADLEAGVGRIYQPPSHTNPFPRIGTPMARVEFVGLRPERVAENIALLPVQDTTGAEAVVRAGKSQFVRAQTNEVVPPMSYREFATLVVRLWMQSPGHRANIVNPELCYLGCSAQTNVNLAGIDHLFCVQVFFTPKN